MRGIEEGFSGTSIKDIWTKPRGVESAVEEGIPGVGAEVVGKWRRLYLNNNKK